MATSPTVAEEILTILDNGARDFIFPMLDNGYFYLAATRLGLFRSPTDWALVFEVFSFSPRAGVPDLCITTFASKIASPKQRDDFVNEDAYLNYLRLHANDETAFFYPVEDDAWIDPEDGERVASDARELLLRGESVAIPTLSDYSAAGILLTDPPQPFIFELCRGLAHLKREGVLATISERRTNVPEDMRPLLTLDDWHHPDVVDSDCLPSGTIAFQQLAAVLASGNASLYRPTEAPNAHWSNWPEGGSL